jgi:hypothetical protein
MAKSLDQFEYEMQHQRFLGALKECLREMTEEELIGSIETAADVLARGFLRNAQVRHIEYKHQFVAVGMLVMALMTAYDKAPVDLAKLPVQFDKVTFSQFCAANRLCSAR